MKPINDVKGKLPDPRREGFASGTEAARFLSLSNAMITKLTKAGLIPHAKFGRAVRIPWAWLLDQVEKADPTGKSAA
jgi:excisionase family DNA binding protein